VLLYHRVDDDFLDSTTVGVEQFYRQGALLRQHYEVLDLKTFLETRSQPRKWPCAVISFDDGYASNYVAAVLLRRAGLPCTFFLPTGIVGTDRPFPNDEARLGHAAPSLPGDHRRLGGSRLTCCRIPGRHGRRPSRKSPKVSALPCAVSVRLQPVIPNLKETV
jgi:hypothetical protein